MVSAMDGLQLRALATERQCVGRVRVVESTFGSDGLISVDVGDRLSGCALTSQPSRLRRGHSVRGRHE